jgi:hypothetical protein
MSFERAVVLGRERAGFDAVLEPPHRLVVGGLGLDFGGVWAVMGTSS